MFLCFNELLLACATIAPKSFQSALARPRNVIDRFAKFLAK